MDDKMWSLIYSVNFWKSTRDHGDDKSDTAKLLDFTGPEWPVSTRGIVENTGFIDPLKVLQGLIFLTLHST